MSRVYLIELNEELKKTQEQLIQSAKMAAVGLLAGGVAHEINNPLTGILNNVQLIKFALEARKDFSGPDFNELLDIVAKSALRCKQIVQGLLEFSRIDKGVFEATAMNEILEKVILLADDEIKLEDIKIIKEFAQELPLVSIERNRFEQVILDLVNNARWALKQKKPAQIKIKTFTTKDKKFVIVEISDNGCGIEKENLNRIFEPFSLLKISERARD